MNYRLQRLTDTSVMVHQADRSYEMSQNQIETNILSLKNNRSAYTNEQQYLDALNLLEGALKLLKEEQA